MQATELRLSETAFSVPSQQYVEERFKLNPMYCAHLKSLPVPWGFGLFSEVVYYRTYSRIMSNGLQERWADTVIRVVEGVFSIRKDWYKKHGLLYDDEQAQPLAQAMATAIFQIKMLPPGRGLWAMGTDYIYERGSMALNNCGFVDIKSDLAGSVYWAMDALMCGVGVGFSTQNAALPKAETPVAEEQTWIIPDSREGWCEATRALIASYFIHGSNAIYFDYSELRPAGTPLKGFGGVSSGAGPLIKLHERLRQYLDTYAMGLTNSTRLICDTMNAVGACVVAGNVRRSAQIATGSVTDSIFLNLKNYETFPERRDIGWMSNNSVILSQSEEFEQLPQISERVRDNGEPGIINLINIQKYGRTGKKKPDAAIGMNPCAEIPLEDRELCNLVEVFPSRCKNVQEVWEMMRLATFYASTVSLLPSHSFYTNMVVARNRRIGVSISGVADWIDATGFSHVTMALRRGYEEIVEPTNAALAAQAGVPTSIRLTTVKPSGTISLLAGTSPGMNWPVGSYVIRRVRISEQSPLVELLQTANIPCEPDAYSDNTLCFSFPLASGNGKTRAVKDVSIWEQVMSAIMLQREWADNSVSNTLTFGKEESSQIEHVLAAASPLVKAISLLPDQTEAYAQLPEERISKETFEGLLTNIKRIDWDDINGIDGQDSKYCDSDSCEIPQ